MRRIWLMLDSTLVRAFKVINIKSQKLLKTWILFILKLHINTRFLNTCDIITVTVIGPSWEAELMLASIQDGPICSTYPCTNTFQELYFVSLFPLLVQIRTRPNPIKDIIEVEIAGGIATTGSSKNLFARARASKLLCIPVS
ncbi:hypothetical protein V8G54_015610 [Vigna mungo]|uniref:Uncharacterized protein n=1 Tax=Vigna mungo TaxID=3915 RepID=A0AAQ3NLF0_VIGMU